MSDLAAGIRDALDAIEARAKAATPGPWLQSRFVDQLRYQGVGDPLKSRWEAEERRIVRSEGPMGPKVCFTMTDSDRGDHDAEFIAKTDPVSVLRQVQGMRQILGRHGDQHVCEDNLVHGEQQMREMNEAFPDPDFPYEFHPCSDLLSLAFMLGVEETDRNG